MLVLPNRHAGGTYHVELSPVGNELLMAHEGGVLNFGFQIDSICTANPAAVSCLGSICACGPCMCMHATVAHA